MKSIQVKKYQSIADIALQEYGGVHGVFWILEDNPTTINSIVDNLQEGQLLWIREKNINTRTKEELSKQLINTMENTTYAEGIGFERIDVDMKVY